MASCRFKNSRGMCMPPKRGGGQPCSYADSNPQGECGVYSLHAREAAGGSTTGADAISEALRRAQNQQE
jgi:hypothetical protein